MLNIYAAEFRPASFQTLADLEELDEVDAANELLADLELLEMQEGIQRALDLVLDEPPTMTTPRPLNTPRGIAGMFRLNCSSLWRTVSTSRAGIRRPMRTKSSPWPGLARLPGRRTSM